VRGLIGARILLTGTALLIHCRQRHMSSKIQQGDAKAAASERRRAALLNLLGDENAGVYQAVRAQILAEGNAAGEWLRPYALSDDPLVRRRVQEILWHVDKQTGDNRFLTFCLNHGEEFDLETAAWLLAKTQFPEINVEAYQALLDGYANALRERTDRHGRANAMLGKINAYLFGELGFKGNEQNYYEPDNSYLNRVLDRRTGNPITLCLFYMLLARRLRLPIAGIGLPGHFICRHQSASGEIFVDVFNCGRLLTKADCVHYLVRGNYDLREEYLAPVSPRRIFLRICSNLHQIYLELGMKDDATRLQRYLVALAR
jgi:regulator of sirC expression with transglutaminase-like and TPR domain